MTNSFWTGGEKAHKDAISQQHKQRMELLQDKINNCSSETARSRLEKEIQTAEDEFQAELRNITWKLF